MFYLFLLFEQINDVDDDADDDDDDDDEAFPFLALSLRPGLISRLSHCLLY